MKKIICIVLICFLWIIINIAVAISAPNFVLVLDEFGGATGAFGVNNGTCTVK